jgi:LacI family transcriptional regulator
MSTSLREIAAIVGVSTTTVVRALKNRPDVKEETKQHIIKVAKELGYRPNILARGLVTNRSFTVGIVVPDLTNPFFPELIKGIETTIWAEGFNAILADTDYDLVKEEAAIESLISRQVDGIVIAPIESRRDRAVYETLHESGVPFVCLSMVQDLNTDLVIADDEAGAYEAVRHLLSLGRRRVLYMGSSLSPRADAERLSGYKKALQEAGVEFDESLVLRGDQRDVDSGQGLMDEYFSSGRTCDAVLSFSDLMALGVMKAVRQRGLSIPSDVAVVGFDDIKVASATEIPLTTVSIPKYNLGEEAANLLLRRIDQLKGKKGDGKRNSNTVAYQKIVLRSTLVVRGSCGASSKMDP